MSTHPQNDLPPSTAEELFQEKLPHLYRSILGRFRKISRSYVNFHKIASSALLAEILFIAFLLFSSQTSSLLAIALGALFLTSFSYVILFLYFQAKKPQQMIDLKEDFLTSCRSALFTPQGTSEHHLSFAEALMKLSHYLQDFEENLPQLPFFLSRFSLAWHTEDVFQLKQQLLEASVEEHLSQVRIAPTDLEVHASLASHYIALARIHQEYLQRQHLLPRRIKKMSSLFQEQADHFSRLAIEEFKILSHYAPNDPWVHEQLALGYKNLNMPEEEIREVELLLKLRPQDKEILFRLGSLYFQQRMNAKGLQVYDELKQANFKRAEELIASYGKYTALYPKL